jgi:hypothetical protein
VANNKSCLKDDFRWETYKKQPRRLSEVQKKALLQGDLQPLLQYALEHPQVRFDIRLGRANLYFEGGTLVRLEGGMRSPFKGVFDERYNNAARGGEGGPVPTPLSTRSQVEELVADLPARQEQMKLHERDGLGRMELRLEQFIARANEPASASEFFVIDIEYSYGRCRPDLVLVDRGELPRPRLILAELKCRGQALCGKAGLGEHAHDFAALVKAGGGTHLRGIKDDLAGLLEQKQELGLAPSDLQFDGFSEAVPLFLVVFADYDIGRQRRGGSLDRALAELHLEMTSAFGGLDLLRFVDFPDVSDRGEGELLRLRHAGLMTWAEFEAYCAARS